MEMFNTILNVVQTVVISFAVFQIYQKFPKKKSYNQSLQTSWHESSAPTTATLSNQTYAQTTQEKGDQTCCSHIQILVESYQEEESDETQEDQKLREDMIPDYSNPIITHTPTTKVQHNNLGEDTVC
jgi:hypothetical protein